MINNYIHDTVAVPIRLIIDVNMHRHDPLQAITQVLKLCRFRLKLERAQTLSLRISLPLVSHISRENLHRKKVQT